MPGKCGLFSTGAGCLLVLAVVQATTVFGCLELRSTILQEMFLTVNSDKLLATGFRPKKTVGDAIGEIVAAYQVGTLRDEDRYYNLKWMQEKILT